MSLSESRFHAVADELLQTVVEAVDTKIGDTAEVDLIGGVLTIDLGPKGQYVVNKHAPNRELWLSSPVSGAWHFQYDADADAWCSTRDRATVMTAVLERELGVSL